MRLRCEPYRVCERDRVSGNAIWLGMMWLNGRQMSGRICNSECICDNIIHVEKLLFLAYKY